MTSCCTRTVRLPALLSALMLGAAATVAGAQSLSSGSNAGSVSQGTPRAGQPGLATGGQTPAATTPNPSASTPLPGQGTMPTQLPPLNASGVGGQSPQNAAPGSVPTRASSAGEAFTMLDRGQVGYVTRADTDRVPGFVGFDNADTNRDGQLTKDEFANAWRYYSGQ